MSENNIKDSKWNDKEFKSNYMKEYCAKYYKEHKELLCSKMDCSCGKKNISISSYKKHLQSEYHKFHSLPMEEQIQLKKENMFKKST